MKTSGLHEGAKCDLMPHMDERYPPGRRLASWLAAKDITTTELAADLGVTRSHLYRLCSGKIAGSDLLRNAITLKTGVDFWSAERSAEG